MSLDLDFSLALACYLVGVKPLQEVLKNVSDESKLYWRSSNGQWADVSWTFNEGMISVTIGGLILDEEGGSYRVSKPLSVENIEDHFYQELGFDKDDEIPVSLLAKVTATALKDAPLRLGGEEDSPNIGIFYSDEDMKMTAHFPADSEKTQTIPAALWLMLVKTSTKAVPIDKEAELPMEALRDRVADWQATLESPPPTPVAASSTAKASSPSKPSVLLPTKRAIIRPSAKMKGRSKHGYSKIGGVRKSTKLKFASK